MLKDNVLKTSIISYSIYQNKKPVHSSHHSNHHYLMDQMSIEASETFNQDDLVSSISDIESSLFDLNSQQATSSSITLTSTSSTANTNTSSNAGNVNKQLIQRVILASMSNVNLCHEILRQVYFLNFEDFTTIQRVLSAYKKWFLKEAKTPSFMHEVPSTSSFNTNLDLDSSSVSTASLALESIDERVNILFYFG